MSDFNRRATLSLMLGAGAVALASNAIAQEMDIDNAAAMSGVSQVAVGSFVVAFLTDRTDRAKAGGGLLGGGFGGRSTARTALEGVSEAEFQRATDSAYEAFLGQLQSAGYQIGDRSAVTAAFRQGNAQPLENGMERDVILARDSRAKARVFAPSQIGGEVWLPREVLGQISAPGFSGNRSAIGISMGGSQFARSTAQGVVNAFYIIDFASAETYGGWFRNSSAVNVQASLAIVPEVSKIFAYAPNGRIAIVKATEPIAIGGDFGTFGDTTTRGQRTAEAITNVIGVLGGIGTNSTRRYAMQADPARWEAGVNELASRAAARMIGAMRSGR